MINPIQQAFAQQLAKMTCLGCGDYLPDLVTDEPVVTEEPSK